MSTTQTRQPSGDSIDLTARDRELFATIVEFEGIMADYQLQRFFGAGERTMRDRLSKLQEHGYLECKTRVKLDLSGKRVGTVYWLGAEGWRVVAEVDDNKPGWPRGLRRKPKLGQIPHDVAINDVHLAILDASRAASAYTVEQWRNSGEFLAFPERVEFLDDSGKLVRRQFQPDSFFAIRHALPNGQKARGKFFLELDNGTEALSRFEREKIKPGLAYLANPAFAKRYGGRAGRWLVVVNTDERRMNALIAQTQLAIGEQAHVFYFTLFEELTAETILAQPVWRSGDTGKTVRLFDPTALTRDGGLEASS